MFVLAGLEATEGLEFERAGNWWQGRVGETMGEGRVVRWVCSILRKSGVSVAYGNIKPR